MILPVRSPSAVDMEIDAFLLETEEKSPLPFLEPEAEAFLGTPFREDYFSPAPESRPLRSERFRTIPSSPLPLRVVESRLSMASPMWEETPAPYEEQFVQDMCKMWGKGYEEDLISLKQWLHANGYSIRERVGAGGWGAVFKVVNSQGQTEVIKIVERVADPDPDCGEAMAAAKISHPNAVTAKSMLYLNHRKNEWSLEGGVGHKPVVFFMPFFSGGSLHERFKRREIPSHADLSQMRLTLSKTMDFVHSLGIAHRDLKPENVLFNEGSWEPFICDWGYARDYGMLQQFVGRPHSPIGTPGFMAPEVICRAMMTCISAADVFALGRLFIEARCPTLGPSVIKEKNGEWQHRHTPWDALQYCKGVDSDLYRTLRHMQDEDPDKRWTMAQVAEREHRLAVKKKFI